VIFNLATLLGRLEECDVYLGSSSVSRRHALMWYDGVNLMLADLHSRSGTRVNYRPLDIGVVSHRDELMLGRYRMTLGMDNTPAPGEQIMAQAALNTIPGPRSRKVIASPLVICGSHERAAMKLRSSSISEIHCAFIPTVWGVFVKDLLSRTGVSVNNQRVNFSRLDRGDTLTIGKIKMSVEIIESGSHREQWESIDLAFKELARRAPKKSRDDASRDIDKALGLEETGIDHNSKASQNDRDESSSSGKGGTATSPDSGSS
jgi:pSer/pThr/pTyr-binding forkhead associated (FHA) protein